MDSIEEISRSCKLLQGLSHAFLDGYLGCIPEPEPGSISDGWVTPSSELRVSSNPWRNVDTTKPSECWAFPQNLCFLSVKKSLRNLSGWEEGKDVGGWALQQRGKPENQAQRLLARAWGVSLSWGKNARTQCQHGSHMPLTG